MLRKLITLLFVVLIAPSLKAQTTTFTSGALEVDVFVSNPCDGSNNGYIDFTLVSANAASADLNPIIGPNPSSSNFGTVSINVGDTFTWLGQAGTGLQSGEFRFYISDGTDDIDRGIFNALDGVFLFDLNNILISATANTGDNSTCQLAPFGPDGQVEVQVTGGSLDLVGGGSISYTWSSDNGLTGLPLTINNVPATTSITLDLATDLGVVGLPGGQYEIEVLDDYSVCSAELIDATIALSDPSPNTYSLQNTGLRQVCDGEGTDIVLLGSDLAVAPEPDVEYNIYINGSIAACADCFETGNGGNLTFSLTDTDFVDGDVITIIASQGSCLDQTMTGSVEIDIVPAATVDAGSNEATCVNSPYNFSSQSIGASASNFASLSWVHDGSGTITGGTETTLTPEYNPVPADAGATITFTLTAFATAPCVNAQDQMTLTITAEPTVDAGAADETCSNAAYTVTDAVITNELSILWTHDGAGTLS
ncbi:MAG: hypothetical protein RIB54_22005, partial [Fulvivirga sp.]